MSVGLLRELSHILVEDDALGVKDELLRNVRNIVLFFLVFLVLFLVLFILVFVFRVILRRRRWRRRFLHVVFIRRRRVLQNIRARYDNQSHGFLQVVSVHLGSTVECGECLGRLDGEKFGAMTLNLTANGLAHQVLDLILRNRAILQPLARQDNVRLDTFRRLFHALHRVFGRVLKVHRLAHRLNAVLKGQHLIRRERHRDAVQQVLAKVALLRVKRRDQKRLTRVLERDAFALDDVFTLGKHGKQQVGDPVVEEVDFVDIKDAPVRLRQQPGLENRLPLLHGLFDVDRTDQTIFRHPERELHERRVADDRLHVPFGVPRHLFAQPLLPLIRLGRVGVAIRILHALDRR